MYPINYLDPISEMELTIYYHILAEYAVNFTSETAIQKTRETWYGIVGHVRKVANAASEIRSQNEMRSQIGLRS